MSSKQEATLIIQRMIKKGLSKRKLEADLHWKIFSDLDTIMENEMLQLASFMKVLMEKIPERALTIDSNRKLHTSSEQPGTTSLASASSSSEGGALHVFEVFENERRAIFPPHAFGPGNLFIHPHFSDASGKQRMDCGDDLSTLKPPAGTEWVGDWKVCKQHTQTDANGWSYAVSYDFLVSNCRNKKSIARSNGRPSRRRRHVRFYRALPGNEASIGLLTGSGINRDSGSVKRSSLYPQFSSPIAVESLDVNVHRPALVTSTSLSLSSQHSGELLPDQPIDMSYASEVIELIRSGRRLSTEMFLRLIFECTEKMRVLPNIVHQQVPSSITKLPPPPLTAASNTSSSSTTTTVADLSPPPLATNSTTPDDHLSSDSCTPARVIVVGDIHGSLADLLYIVDHFGMPSSQNRFIFNGDFVDRGDMGIEIMSILMVLYLATPDDVILNRGNHEDRTINGVYGFQEECITKYDLDTFEKICCLFDCMPLFVILSNTIFIVHGGLFLDRTVTFEDLERLNRFDYECQAEVPYPQCLEFLTTAEEQWDAFGKELMRNALWSDPRPEPGLDLSHRGSGVIFGPDVAQEFMTNNNIKMIIRSHEVCKQGFYLPFGKVMNPALYNPSLPLLCTVFSASNYSNSGNDAAVLIIGEDNSINSHAITNSPYRFSIHRFKTSSSTEESLEANNKSSLSEIVRKKRTALLSEFRIVDHSHSGWVTRNEWADVMQRITTLKIRWLGVIGSVVPATALTSTKVHYIQFLEHFSMNKHTQEEGKVVDMDALYSHRKRLEVMFSYFDVNGDGVITHEEFTVGCQLLNEHLPEGQKLTDISTILGILDFDGSGEIDLNEFFEAFRILESRAMI